MKPPAPEFCAESIGGRRRAVALIALLGLLLILALRLTITETLRQPLTQNAARLAAVAAGKGNEIPKFIGAAAVTGFAVLTFFFSALAAMCGAVNRSISRRRFVGLALIVVVGILGVSAAFHAANRFSAIVGAVDLGSAMLAAWSIGVVCRALGDTGRRIVVAALIAVLATWTFRGLYERFVESPDAIAQYYKDKPAELRQMGINADDAYAVKLFESRMLGMEVNGFIALSNVMAEGLIGLIALLAGLLAARFVPFARVLPPVARSREGLSRRGAKRASEAEGAQEISVPNLLLTLGIVLMVAALVTTFLTRSRGGSVLAAACIAGIALGTWRYRSIIARRKAILSAAGAAAICVIVAVLVYGLTFHALPSKSLTFRWQYWTGAARIIEHSPLHGVGLYNFGEHYTAVKLPSSPEDVADPHSFFIRAAAEMGIPAAILLAVFILWKIASSVRAVNLAPAGERRVATGWGAFLGGLGLAILWWTLRFFLAEDFFAFNVYLLFIFAIVAAAAAWMALELMAELSAAGIRVVCVAALVGAVGMLAYDQINMGLLTGSVNMLFWCLLGLADSYDFSEGGRARGVLGWVAAAIPAGAAIAAGGWLFLPIVQERMAWNPAPFETRTIQAINLGDYPAALGAIDEAIQRDPRNIELRNQRIAIKQTLRLPVAADIRYIVGRLDLANASIRIALGMHDSDLPAAERAEILEQALRLNDALPADETKRLSAAQVERVRGMIQSLKRPHATSQIR